MPLPNYLEVQCSKCKVAEHCPAKGSSPIYLSGGRKMLVCRLPNGYGREPPRPEAVSEESKKLQAEHGECLTLADVPRLDAPSGHVYYETVKIWHPAVRHPRESTDFRMDMMYPRSHR